MEPPKRRIIIVDGVTNSGKTTAINILRKQIPGCTLIKFSDYYHKSLQRAVGEVSGQIDTSDPRVIDQIVSDNLGRYLNVLHLAIESPLDDYLIERLHPSDYVHRAIVFGIKEVETYRTVEEELNNLNVKFILLSVNDNVLEERSRATLEKRVRKNGASFEVPNHVLSLDCNLRKRDLYLEWYEQSALVDKQMIDTSLFSEGELRERLG